MLPYHINYTVYKKRLKWSNGCSNILELRSHIWTQQIPVEHGVHGFLFAILFLLSISCLN